MKDLVSIVSARLAEQPPVRTPPFAQIRQQARRRIRRRNTLSGLCLLALSTAAVVGAQTAVSQNRQPERVGGPTSDPLVPVGAIGVYACPDAPGIFGQEKLCGSTNDAEVVRELVRLVNAAAATPTDASGCSPGDADVRNVGLQFEYADGERASVEIMDCILISPVRPERPAAYASDVARTAARLLRPAPPRSTKEGCAAVIEDVEAVLAQNRQDDVAYAVQVAEATIAEQRGRLSPAQRVIADDIKPAVTSYLYDEPDAETLQRGLDQLRASCPG